MGQSHRTNPAQRSPTVGELIQRSTPWLQDRGVESPRLDAELLLAYVLGCDRLRIYMEWGKPLTELEIAAYRDAIRRRGQEREPVERITGKRDFYGRSFEITADVFSPRPETEGLVDRALDFLRSTDAAGLPSPPVVFDACTGSGVIIVTIAAEMPGVRCYASEKSPAALAIARRNAERLGTGKRIHFLEGTNFAGFDGAITAFLSNPPYIRHGEIPELPAEVRYHDPMLALDGGPDGLTIVRELVEGAARLLVPGGFLALEIGEEQGRDTRAILTASGAFQDIRIERDLTGRERYAVAVAAGSR